jgi:radical S-adenosyl methionine domain-containing protein 2
MRCKFCFATFQDVKHTILPKGHLKREDAIRVVDELAFAGFKKITFAGGEPTLGPWLPDLIRAAKSADMTTMIVTNGTRLTDEFLRTNRDVLDWIALSIDSLTDSTNLRTGRAAAGRNVVSQENYLKLTDKIKMHGYGLKINTVVHDQNWQENLSQLIEHGQPARWKVLKVLSIAGQNDQYYRALSIENWQFEHFLKIHENLKSRTNIVPEYNDNMKGSYAMVDPAGRFIDNADGLHRYSKAILDSGAIEALKEVRYNIEKFQARGGLYDWQRPGPAIPEPGIQHWTMSRETGESS